MKRMGKKYERKDIKIRKGQIVGRREGDEE
jgi:hypothetical protein